MEQDNFFELFYSNLRKELNDNEFVDSLEELISQKKFNRVNYLKLIKGE